MSNKFDDFLKEQLQDSEFRQEYEAFQPERAVIQAIIDARQSAGRIMSFTMRDGHCGIVRVGKREHTVDKLRDWNRNCHLQGGDQMALDLILQEAQGLSEESLMEVLRFMKFIKAEGMKTADTKRETEHSTDRKAGLYRGQIWMADDFDAPLSEFKEYM